MRMWDLDDLANTGDLAREYGVGVTAVTNWRDRGGFPPPLITLSGGPVYSRAQIAAWQERRRRPGRPAALRDKYDWIAEDLRARIRAGEWQPGDRLPSRVALGEHYGVTDYSMSYPIAELRREGLVTSARGSGTYVSYVQIPEE